MCTTYKNKNSMIILVLEMEDCCYVYMLYIFSKCPKKLSKFDHFLMSAQWCVLFSNYIQYLRFLHTGKKRYSNVCGMFFDKICLHFKPLLRKKKKNSKRELSQILKKLLEIECLESVPFFGILYL